MSLLYFVADWEQATCGEPGLRTNAMVDFRAQELGLHPIALPVVGGLVGTFSWQSQGQERAV